MRTFKKGAKQALKTDVLEELAQAEEAQLATAGAEGSRPNIRAEVLAWFRREWVLA